jgi:hypothetical protein
MDKRYHNEKPTKVNQGLSENYVTPVTKYNKSKS